MTNYSNIALDFSYKFLNRILIVNSLSLVKTCYVKNQVLSTTRWPGGGSDYTMMMLSSECIELSTGGSVYSPDIGGDTFLGVYISTDMNQEIYSELNQWEESFYAHLPNLSIVGDTTLIPKDEIPEKEDCEEDEY